MMEIKAKKDLFRCKRLLIVVFLCMVLLSMGGCKADISGYADQEIKISGLTEEDFIITVGELADMDCESATAVGTTQKAGTVKAYGPTLETLAETYGRSLDEFRSVKFCAADDYDVTLAALTWDSYDVILSVANGSEPLDEYQQPIRLVIPGADSGKWVRMVEEIEFTEYE
ncbi:MAG: molybdopterin-dependent oxidoreductase [Lachnospiraceae bacterium]|nr:molybdopterin-dependent oxidoreductase [Lachnospiraceae bacterium]